MIADLVRNDLGKVAQSGTVFTKAALRHCGVLLHAEQSICAFRSEITVQQLLSTIFPAGSITGAQNDQPRYLPLSVRHKLYRCYWMVQALRVHNVAIERCK